MVRVPDYFFSTNPDKQTLHYRITPSIKQRENQQIRWNDLCDYLISKLNEKTNYQVKSWIQGSYKFGTQIRPVNKQDEFDIDLGIYFEWEGGSEDGNFSAKELKHFVQEELVSFKNENEDVIEVLDPPKERCSRIRFNDCFHIDVPAYHLDENVDLRELATESDIWEDSDPKAFYLWFRDHFTEDDCNQVRRLIRYFKILSRLHLENPPSSILLTVLVAEAYELCLSTEVDGDDLATRTVAEKIINRLEKSMVVNNPVNDEENLNRMTKEDSTSFLDVLKNTVDVADKAIQATSEAASSILWGKIFRHFFPIADSTEDSGGEKSLVAMKFVPEVSVIADSIKSGTHYHKNGQNEIRSIPRDCKILFILTNISQLPAGSRISWIVRNEGTEAEYKNDLGHLANLKDKPYMAREEHSEYAGIHYMDISIMSSIGEIIGFRRIPVEITGQYFPPRNKPRSFHGPRR